MASILVAVDGSPGAQRALAHACRLAAQQGAHLVLVHVIGGLGLPEPALRALAQTKHGWFDEMLDAASAEVLQQAREQALAQGVSAPTLESRRGDVVPALLEAARAHAAESIVVGRRGAHHAVALPLGSVSRAVASLSPIPAIVVP